MNANPDTRKTLKPVPVLVMRDHFNTGTGDRGRAFIALFQPDNPDTQKMKTLTWNEFVENVQNWATERGIYEHSTPEAQLLKALSELGEVADAIVKGDKNGLIDGIGDVIVCLVNYAKMMSLDSTINPFHPDIKNLVGVKSEWMIGFISAKISGLLCSDLRDKGDTEHTVLYEVFVVICAFAHSSRLDFMECCTTAWNEIKSRKGRVVAGGAFVKDE